MTNFSPIFYSFTTELSEFFKNSLKSISNSYVGRTFEWFKSLPEQMQNSRKTAITVFVTTNAIFFALIYSFANFLEDRVYSSPQKLSIQERRFNAILIDGFVVGGSMLVFNTLLSQITRYSLPKTLLVVISIAAIMIRCLLHSRPDVESSSCPTTGDDQENSPDEIPSENSL